MAIDPMKNRSMDELKNDPWLNLENERYVSGRMSGELDDDGEDEEDDDDFDFDDEFDDEEDDDDFDFLDDDDDDDDDAE